MPTELKPCPFCGEADALYVEHLEGTVIHPAHRVLCDGCGASTGYTDHDHVAAWNARARELDAADGRSTNEALVQRVVGVIPAPLTNSQAWPTGYVSGFNDCANVAAEMVAAELRACLATQEAL